MNEEIHIGKLIGKKLEEEGRSARWLAKQIPCTRANIYKILNSQHLHPKILYRISIKLKFDFFVYYSESVRKEICI